jgi:hypothetical protein
MIAEAEQRLVRVSVSATPDGLGSGLNRIKEWLDPNCGANGWAMKKAALDQQASDAARRLFPSEGLSPGDVRTRPVSIMGTGRQQTVHQTRRGSLCSGADQIDPFGRHIGRIAK